MRLSPRIIFILIAMIAFVSACKKEEPNPENFDPIYQDLLKDLKVYTTDLSDEEKSFVDLMKERKTVEPRTVENKVNQKAIKKSIEKVDRLRQLVKYYEIRSERRRIEARRDYKIAFQKGEAWPSPQENQRFVTNKRLVNAPMNWNLRVPKLDKSNPNFRGITKKAEKKEGGGGGGEKEGGGGKETKAEAAPAEKSEHEPAAEAGEH